MKKKEKQWPKDYDINEMVDFLAGDALQKLIRGEQWRSIIYMVCIGAVQWDRAQKFLEENSRLRKKK